MNNTKLTEEIIAVLSILLDSHAETEIEYGGDGSENNKIHAILQRNGINNLPTTTQARKILDL